MELRAGQRGAFHCTADQVLSVEVSGVSEDDSASQRSAVPRAEPCVIILITITYIQAI